MNFFHLFMHVDYYYYFIQLLKMTRKAIEKIISRNSYKRNDANILIIVESDTLLFILL